jgi:hypothetical protein
MVKAAVLAPVLSGFFGGAASNAAEFLGSAATGPASADL